MSAFLADTRRDKSDDNRSDDNGDDRRPASRHLHRHSQRGVTLRRIACLLAFTFAWSLLAPSAGAALLKPPLPPGHIRALTAREMQTFVGANAIAHRDSVDSAAGSSLPWEASTGGVNTINGNKLTRIPLVGWSARGGLPVAFTLVHNSQSSHNSELGYNWTHSFDIYLLLDTQNSIFGDATVHWGDDLACVFVKDINDNFLTPTGFHDTLVANGNPITSYDLTTKNQVRYRFTNPNGTGWRCTSITDRNNN